MRQKLYAWSRACSLLAFALILFGSVILSVSMIVGMALKILGH